MHQELSVHSWPIEVGISWIDMDQVKTWSYLIRPHSVWDIADWPEQSEAVHQISVSVPRRALSGQLDVLKFHGSRSSMPLCG